MNKALRAKIRAKLDKPDSQSKADEKAFLKLLNGDKGAAIETRLGELYAERDMRDEQAGVLKKQIKRIDEKIAELKRESETE